MIGVRLSVGVLAAAFAAGCASVPPAPAASSPRYPLFPYPHVPESLAATAQLRARHDGAWQRLQAGDLGGAAQDFRQIVQQAPQFFPAEAGLAFVAMAEREFDEAARRFDRVVSLAPAYLPGWQGLADARLEQRDEAGAMVALERVVALDPTQESALRGRIELLRFREVQRLMSAGREARERGRTDDAIAALARALELAPTSVVILRDLAEMERARGDLDQALAHARRAVDLESGDGEAHAVLGAILEARGDLGSAAAAFSRAASIENRADWRAQSDDLAERARLAALPEEFTGLPAAIAVTRAQVAAAIGVRLEALVTAAPRRVSSVATDVRDHWAATWILAVTQAGLMEIFPNHTFQPAAVVRRTDFAPVVHELLKLAAADRPADLARWAGATPRFSDMPPTHLGFRAAAAAVSSGAMAAQDGRFAPSRPVTGAELLAAVARIAELANR